MAGIVNRSETFRPNDFVTRAETLKMVLSAKGISPSSVDQGFLDPASDASLNGYVNAAAQRGIVGK